MTLIVCYAHLWARGPSKREKEDLTHFSPQLHLNGVPLAHGRGNVLCLWSHEACGLRFHDNVDLELFSH